ncbi:hypothetical protein [Ralstonia wenshanensis]|uniref:hypothetical protein n=1 Tax=Ralstonia wenshanensis TaxID=2842456 RepID=UPI002AAD9FF0|nr:hypothetical protein [Ralstonia wenshanensis]MDY7511399.1 hypothetical protein [Ralstonia wenshanensis]
MILSIKDNWDQARSHHQVYVRDRVERHASDLATAGGAKARVAAFLNAIGDDIGTAPFHELTNTIPVFNTYLEQCKTEEERVAFRGTLREVFDYDSFAAKTTPGWNAYGLCKLSRTRTCPYCNQAYAFTVVHADSGKGFRPTLDHFLPKHVFPHLALSLSNLIPSCYTCNSNLKGRLDFYKHPHLHPLYDDESIKFELKVPGVDHIELVSNFEAMKHRAVLGVTWDNESEKATNSARTFLIAERYDSHQADAVDFASLHILFDKNRIADIRKIGINISQEQILRFDRAKYREVLLGKMYADVFDLFARDN